jgi:5-methylcytosine-specific restriction endonuclease McrA
LPCGQLERKLGLDRSHFTGTAWTKGRPRRDLALPLADILVEGSTYGSARLRERLVAEGLLIAECAECGATQWRGERLPLHLDHINGDHTDNRLENLRILCPNCHSIMKTWCNRRGRRSPTGRRQSF